MDFAMINSKINKDEESWQGGREAHAKVKQMKPELKGLLLGVVFVFFAFSFCSIFFSCDLSDKRRKKSPRPTRIPHKTDGALTLNCRETAKNRETVKKIRQ
jgi:hypothetical protein